MMKIFNKLIACFIIASFVFSSEGFAVRPTRDGHEHQRITARKRVPHTAIRTRMAPKRALTRTSRFHRPEQGKRISPQPVRVQRNVMARQPLAQRRSLARAARPAIASRNVIASEPLSQRRSLVRAASPARTSRNTPAVNANLQNPVKAARPTRAPRNIAPAVSAEKRQFHRRAPAYYTINTNDVPQELKEVLKIFGVEEGQERVTALELRQGLAELQKEEDKYRGFTQRVRQAFQAKGYNGGAEDIILTGHDISHFSLLCAVDIPNFDRNNLDRFYSAPQSSVTALLNQFQEVENRSVGVTQRTRQFLKSKYGFQG